MKKTTLFLGLAAMTTIGFSSCKKYACNCSVTYYDSSGSYVSSSSESHVVKARGVFRAEAKCDLYSEDNVNVSKVCSVLY